MENSASIQRLKADHAKTKSAITNMLVFVKEGVAVESTRQELVQLDQKLLEIAVELTSREKAVTRTVAIPSIDELKSIARERLGGLATDSYQFARIIRLVVPRIVVFPYRLCDGGKIVLRGKFRLQIGNRLSDYGTADALRGPLEKIVEVDFFEPPQREKHRQQIVAVCTAGSTARAAAESLGITAPAAQNALSLQRQMDKAGLTDAYVLVTQPPDDNAKLRRHRHPDYRFDPLPGAGNI